MYLTIRRDFRICLRRWNSFAKELRYIHGNKTLPQRVTKEKATRNFCSEFLERNWLCWVFRLVLGLVSGDNLGTWWSDQVVNSWRPSTLQHYSLHCWYCWHLSTGRWMSRKFLGRFRLFRFMSSVLWGVNKWSLPNFPDF